MSDELIYDALNIVPDFLHITLHYDWMCKFWIVTLDGTGHGCEEKKLEVSTMNKPNMCLHELIIFASSEYEKRFEL